MNGASSRRIQPGSAPATAACRAHEMLAFLPVLPSPFLGRPRAATLRALAGGSALALLLSGCTGTEKPEVLYELVLPQSGAWETGSIHPVRWGVPDMPGLDAALTVAVSHDSGETWFELAEAPVEDRKYLWKIPEGFQKARIAILFHRTDADGILTDVALAESKDVTIVPSTARAYGWEKKTDRAAFGQREGAGAIVHRDKLWLVGGKNVERFPLGAANDVWSSTDGATWIEEKRNTYGDPAFDPSGDWEGRAFAGAQAFAGKMWLVGGDVGQGRYRTDAWSSDDGRAWKREVDAAAFGGRTGAVTAVLGGKLYVLGGQRIVSAVPANVGGAATGLNDVWASTDGAAFSRVETGAETWSPRGFVSSAPTVDGKLWLVGGGLLEDLPTVRSRTYRNEIWSSRDGAGWETVVEEPPFSRRLFATAIAFDEKLWILGGGASRYAEAPPDLEELSPDAYYTADGRNWYSAEPPEELRGRSGAAAWATRDALYFGSGNDGTDEGRAEIWRIARRP